MNCKNCNAEVTNNYCAECGNPVKIKRIDRKYVINEIEHIIHFDKGILYTVRQLLIKPGESIRCFLTENRKHLIKPILFIVTISIIYSIAISLLHVDDSYIVYDDTMRTTDTLIFKWFQLHYGYLNIILGFFITIWVKILFKNYNFNLYEVLICQCFILGMGMFFLMILAIFQKLTGLNAMRISFVVIIYYIWATCQFFDKRKLTNYLKAFVAYFLGILTFLISIISIGKIIDFVMSNYIH